MTTPLTRSIAATAARRAMRRGMVKSTGGRRAGRSVRGTGGYRCDDVKGGAELCTLRAGRYAEHGGGSVELKETVTIASLASLFPFPICSIR